MRRQVESPERANGESRENLLAVFAVIRYAFSGIRSDASSED
jgi:hypothetical protein